MIAFLVEIYFLIGIGTVIFNWNEFCTKERTTKQTILASLLFIPTWPVWFAIDFYDKRSGG